MAVTALMGALAWEPCCYSFAEEEAGEGEKVLAVTMGVEQLVESRP